MFFPCPLDSCLVFDPRSRKERSFKMSVRASSPWDEELSSVLTDQRIVVLSYWWGNAVCMCVSTAEGLLKLVPVPLFPRDLNTKLSTTAVVAAHVASGGLRSMADRP